MTLATLGRAGSLGVPVWRAQGRLVHLASVLSDVFCCAAACLLAWPGRNPSENGRSVRIRSRDVSVPLGTSGACREVPLGTCLPSCGYTAHSAAGGQAGGAPQGPGSPPPTRGRQGPKRHRNLPAFPPGLAPGAFLLESPDAVCGRAPNSRPIRPANSCTSYRVLQSDTPFFSSVPTGRL